MVSLCMYLNARRPTELCGCTVVHSSGTISRSGPLIDIFINSKFMFLFLSTIMTISQEVLCALLMDME